MCRKKVKHSTNRIGACIVLIKIMDSIKMIRIRVFYDICYCLNEGCSEYWLNTCYCIDEECSEYSINTCYCIDEECSEYSMKTSYCIDEEC